MINIILIHKGIFGRKKDDYLSVALKCAYKFNPQANIFLISDNNSPKFDFVNYKKIEDYFISADSFSKNYQHFSTNSYDFELFCIQRWFILRDFMKNNNLDECFYIDSDVLIFSDLFMEQQKFSNFSFTLSEGTCGHNSFWNNFEAINNFCNFVENIYNKNDKDTYNNIVNFWKKYKISGNLGGVCDMTLFKFYKQKYPNLIGETTKIIDNSTYDHNISCVSQGGADFKNIFGVKNVCWKNNLPYVKNSFGELIKFNTLHCQGWAKKIMNKIFLEKKVIPFRFLSSKIFNYFLKKVNLLKAYNSYKGRILNLLLYKNKRLLIIKLDAIGDYVLFRNFLEEIKKSELYKDYKITFLGNIIIKDLVENLDKEFIDSFIWFNKEEIKKNPLKIFKIINLINKKFDIIIQASCSRRFVGDLFVRLSRSKIKVGFDGDCNNISLKYKKITDKWYNKLININEKNVFEFYKNREFFSKILNKELTIRKPFIDTKSLKINKDVLLPNDFVILFPGASSNERRWPVDKFKEIANYLIDKYNLNVVICGSNSDSINFNSKNVLDVTGKTDLAQLVYIISKSKMIISNDTSGAHIGAALNIPTIVLSQFNHYCRFVPYPNEISDKIVCLTPNIFNNLTYDELVKKFSFGSDIDISLISVNMVKERIDLILNKII